MKNAPFADTARRRALREAQNAAADRSRAQSGYVIARLVGMSDREARRAAGMPS